MFAVEKPNQNTEICNTLKYNVHRLLSIDHIVEKPNQNTEICNTLKYNVHRLLSIDHRL